METKKLDWKATIKPDKRKGEKWVYFKGSSDTVIKRNGSKVEKIVVEPNPVAEEMTAEVVVCQYDEDNNPRTEDTKKFYIKQDKTCVSTIDTNSNGYKLDTCATKFIDRNNNEYGSIIISGVTIPASQFSPNCSLSEKSVTQNISSTMSCNGRYVTVKARQNPNTTAYTSNNITSTTMTNIVFPNEGGEKEVTATAAREVSYGSCDCQPYFIKTDVVFDWVVEGPIDRKRTITKTFTSEGINGQGSTDFVFTATQDGPECGGWKDEYLYGCDRKIAISLLSVYNSSGRCIYASASKCVDNQYGDIMYPNRVPSWAEGTTTLEFPYYQSYQDKDTCEINWKSSKSNGVVNGTISPSLTDENYFMSGIIPTNGGYSHQFDFTIKRISSGYERKYFTIRALSDTCKVTFTKKTEFDLKCSTNFGNSFDSYSGPISITKGYTILFYANVGELSEGNGLGRFTVEGDFNVEGNIMSLIYGENFSTKDYSSLSNRPYAFMDMFYEQSGLIYAKDLVLPSTTLSDGCYLALFRHCKNMIEGPTLLPAATLTKQCYHLMYQGTKTMKILPVLHASIYEYESCKQMFEGSGVEIIPSNYLGSADVNKIKEGSIWSMFNGCTSLVKAMDEVPFKVTAFKSHAFMFKGCTKLVESPVFPAEELASAAYYGLFEGCRNLNKITALFKKIEYNSLSGWTYKVSSNGTFYKNPESTIDSSKLELPSGWNVVSNS